MADDPNNIVVTLRTLLKAHGQKKTGSAEDALALPSQHRILSRKNFSSYALVCFLEKYSLIRKQVTLTAIV